MQQRTNALDDGAVAAFRNAVVLGGIVNGEFLLRAARFEVEDELLPQVLAAAIRMHNLDVGLLVCRRPRLKLFVGVEGLILGF